MKAIFSAVALCALLLTSQLHSQDSKPGTDSTAEAEKLPTNIETVVSGGYWERGDQDGTYRLIILLEGWEHLSNRVLLQWIRRDRDKQELIVEQTVPIKEITADGAWRISEAKFVKSQFVLQVNSERMGKTNMVIIPSADDQYKFFRGVK